MLKGLVSFSREGTDCIAAPVTDDPSLRIGLPSTDIPYRDLVVFTLLGMGKTLVFRSIGEKRISLWKEQARKFGCTLNSELFGADWCLSLESRTGPTLTAVESVTETDAQPLIGLCLGAGSSATFLSDVPLVSPLRSLAPVLGFSFEVKSGYVREQDEVVRRLQLMQHKQRPGGSGQQFTVTVDFSRANSTSADPVVLTLPGDELAGALFIAAKCLFPKSQLVIGNLPLETWATPVVAFIRKMGCKVSLQETGRTSFGSVGIIHAQTPVLTGRKLECDPAVLYLPFIASMVVVAAFAENETVLRGLGELRADIPDGIEQIEKCIRTLGAHHGEMPDGIVLKGGRDYDGFDIAEPLPAACGGAFAIAALRCIGTSTINDEGIGRRLPYLETMLKEIGEYRN
jgi:hypothetical protein